MVNNMTVNQIVSIPKDVTFNPLSESSSLFTLPPEIIARIGLELSAPERAYLCMTCKQGLQVASGIEGHLRVPMEQRRKELLKEMESLLSSLEEIGLATIGLRNEIMPAIEGMTLKTFESTCRTIDLSILSFFHLLPKEKLKMLHQAKVLQGRVLEILEIAIRFSEAIRARYVEEDNHEKVAEFCTPLVHKEPHLVMGILNLRADDKDRFCFNHSAVLDRLVDDLFPVHILKAIQLVSMSRKGKYIFNHCTLAWKICWVEDDAQCIRLLRMVPDRDVIEPAAWQLISQQRMAAATEVVRLLSPKEIQGNPVFQKLVQPPRACSIL